MCRRRASSPSTTTSDPESRCPPPFPATFLVILGALLAVLGLFAAGNLAVVVVGLLAIFGAGLLTLAETRR